MNTASEFIAELGAADEFVSHLQQLTCKGLGEHSRRVEDVRATTAGDVEWWRATAAVSRRLRLLHRSRAAAIVALRASEAVLGAPEAVELPASSCPRSAAWISATSTGDLGQDTSERVQARRAKRLRCVTSCQRN
jgi:hypothetical protein